MAFRSILLIAALSLLGACSTDVNAQQDQSANDPRPPSSTPTSSYGPITTPDTNKKQDAKSSGTKLASPPPAGMEVATFAGGCFWCMEPPFEKLKGVKSAVSGYTGGTERGPTYKEVSYGKTTHTEAVRVVFDPKVVSYGTLVETFWMSMDPTDAGGQFADRGAHYRPAIFFHNDAQRKAAETSKRALQDSKRFSKPIAVPIEPASDFWIAEAEHQDFYKTNPTRYNGYSNGSGRVAFIKKHWPDKK